MASAAVLLVLSALPGLGQLASPPDRLTYQGYLVDGNGKTLGGTNIGPKNFDVVFRIWNDQNAADPKKNLLWSEQQTITVDNGYFSVLLGEGSALAGEPTGSIAALFLSPDADHRFVEITVKGAATGQDATISPRIRLMPGAYSFLATYSLNAVNAQFATVAGSLGSVNSAVSVTTTNYNSASFLQINGPTLFTAPATKASEVDIVGPTSTLRLTAKATGGNSIQSLGTTPTTDSALSFADHTGAPILSIAPGGRVGIGVAAPAATLDVNGSANITGNTTVTGAATITGTATITSNAAIGGSATVAGSATITGVTTSASFVGAGTIPVGGIILWSGTAATVPTGWAICDGSTVNGLVTPNLQDRFVMGAGKTSINPIKSSGGGNPVTLTVNQLPAHNHDYHDGYYFDDIGDSRAPGAFIRPGGMDTYSPNVGGNSVLADSGSSDIETSSSQVERLYWRLQTTASVGNAAPITIPPPAFYALAYIMRVQ